MASLEANVVVHVAVMEPLAVKADDAARLLGGVSPTTLYNLRKKGLIKAVPIDSEAGNPKLLYLVESIRDFLNGVKPVTEPVADATATPDPV